MKKLNLLSYSIKAAIVAGACNVSIAAANTDTNVTKTERIQVTGSRIKRMNLTSPTPVTVIGGVDLENQGITNVNDLLKEMPQATVGLSPETTTNFIFASGLNTTDLRGLGSERTLVLVNGRRYVPGSVGDTAVDLNNIPTSMIERVEIATGGAAAVYGADAVAGVVNIITKKSFDGLEIDASTIQTEHSGGETHYFSVTGGVEEGNLSFISSINYTEQKAYSKLSRDFYANPVNTYRNPENTSSEDGIPGRVILGQPTTLAYYSEAGDFFTKGGFDDDAYNNHHYIFNADGSVRPFDYGLGRIPNPGIGSDSNSYFHDAENPGDGIFSDGYRDFFVTPLERVIISNYGTYDLNADHALTFDLTWSQTDSKTQGTPPFFAHTIRRDNAYLHQSVKDLMDENELDTLTVRQSNAGLWGNREYEQTRELFRTSIGAEGLLNDDWGYSTYFQFGRVEQDTTWTGEVMKYNLANAIDAVELNGDIVCADRNAAGEVVGALAGCVPFNTMGATSATPEQMDYISTVATRFARHDQAVFAVTVDGTLFELPAGFVSAAFTAEHRRETATITPSENMEKGLIRGNSSLPMDGKTDVDELSAEISVPLLEDHFLATDLTLETAFRYMDYSVTGEDNAWKIALNWGVTDELRVRLNRSKSVRAPSMNNLFQPKSVTYSGGRADICRADTIEASDSIYKDNVIRNCQADGMGAGWMPTEEWQNSASLEGYIQGNPELTNETSNDYTIGLIYTPSFIDGVDITVDYWSFEIEDAIQYFGRDSVAKCYESESLENVFCSNVIRNEETRDIEYFLQRPVNAATITKRGMDFESSYKFDALGGDVSLRLTATYMIEDNGNTTGFDADHYNTVGELSSPRWKARLSATYALEDTVVALTSNYRHSSVYDSDDWNIETNNYNDIPSYTTFDLMVKSYVMDELQIRVGVNNLLDRVPPRNPFTYDNGEYYDVKGRRFTLGLKYNF